MKMHTFALLTTLFASLAAAQLNYYTGNEQTAGHCDTLSLTDVTASNPNAANSTDCNDTCQTMFWDAADWIIDPKGTPEGYIQHNTSFLSCSFAMDPIPSTAHKFSFLVNNQDIADIIDEVVNGFAGLQSGRVAAQGGVRCNGHEAMWDVGVP